MERNGVIILVHGSRGERGIIATTEVWRRLSAGLKPLLAPGTEVTGAALQFNHPSLEEAVEGLAARGTERVVIMPYFLFPGRHITEDVPGLVEQFRRRYGQMRFTVADPLGLGKSFVTQVAECIIAAAPELAADGQYPVSPGSIEKRSMDIVAGLLPVLPGLSKDELAVVKRMVHASGDPEVARMVRFGNGAVSSGLAAIGSGCPIFTDVRMVSVGINGCLAGQYGCAIGCALDTKETGDTAGLTRAAAAMRGLGGKLNGAMVAIGNAPTALLALLDLVDTGEAKPALVVGMPVGFVQARESKDELMKRDIPWITVAGTRGGSAMAAATVNALLKIAAGGKFSQ